jgi:hypothetical protein
MRFEMRFDGLEINRTRDFIVRAGIFVGVLSFFHSFIRFDWVGVLVWFGDWDWDGERYHFVNGWIGWVMFGRMIKMDGMNEMDTNR